MRDHVPPRRLPPLVVMPDGSFPTSLEEWPHCRPNSISMNARCVGSTNSWLALVLFDDNEYRPSYMLHDPFTSMTVPLPELDAIISGAPNAFQIRKVLMRSTPDNIIAVMPNNRNCPLILIMPGKGAWVSNKPQTTALPTRIIDVAFLGDRLYGITEAEDLICLEIALDVDGVPEVTSTHYVIRHSNEDVDDTNNIHIHDGILYAYDDEHPFLFTIMITTLYFIEMRGKLLMLRWKFPDPRYNGEHTRKVEVFEADITSRAWIPVTGGLDANALFVSKLSSMSIPAGGEVEEDDIHFIDTRQTFNVRSQMITSLPHDHFKYRKFFRDWKVPTWIFPPELVV